MRLPPRLNLLDSTAIGLGAIIGGGIFIVTGMVAGLAGPALIISILLAAAISFFTALSFVELTEHISSDGSVYIYGRRIISPFFGFLGGWMWIFSTIFTGAAVSLGFAHYFASLFHGWNYRLIAVLLVIFFTALNYFGIKHSALFNNLLVLAKLGVLAIFIGVGMFHFQPAHFEPFLVSKIGIFQGAFFIFFAFSGFARIATMAEEVKNPRKTVPRSIILALSISSVIYIIVGMVALGLAGAGVLGRSNSPLAEAIKVVGSPTLTYIVSLGGMLAMASVLLTSILGVSRMAFAMAREQDLPAFLSRLHPKHKMPYFSILLVGLIIAIVSLLSDLAGVVAVSTFATLFNYSLANISAFKLEAKKVYPKAIPATGLALCLFLMLFVHRDNLMAGMAVLVVGVIFYCLRKKRAEKTSGINKLDAGGTR